MAPILAYKLTSDAKYSPPMTTTHTLTTSTPKSGEVELPMTPILAYKLTTEPLNLTRDQIKETLLALVRDLFTFSSKVIKRFIIV
jgi:hypothetical protein